MTDKTNAAAADWSLPKPREDGVHVAGDGLPLNHRLRAEALVAAKATSDPGGLVSGELIADTAARLKAEAEAAVATAKPLRDQNKRELRATAQAEDVVLPTKATKDVMVGLIEAARAVAIEPPATDEGTEQ